MEAENIEKLLNNNENYNSNVRFWRRFRKVGYKVPKPLIKVDGIHMIGHVVNLSQRKVLYLYVMKNTFRRKLSNGEIIKSYCPTGKIVSIKPHKLGPVHAVLEVSHLINLNEKVIVNYCDFSCFGIGITLNFISKLSSWSYTCL